MGRVIGKRMSEGLGQPVLVENRPGAGGTLAMEAAARAPADGYTMTLGTTTTLGIAPALYAHLGYDPKKSFAPVGLVVSTPFLVVVNPAVGAHSLAELIALAKEKPGQLNYASIGNGTAPHIAGELFQSLTGVKLVHVPYKGGAPALIGLLSGEAQIMIDVPADFQDANLHSARLRALAVAAPRRYARLPEVPTAAEQGLPDFDVSAWFGIVVPRGTPEEAIARLSAELVKTLADPEVTGALARQGMETSSSTPQEFDALIDREIRRWGSLVRASGARVD